MLVVRLVGFAISDPMWCGQVPAEVADKTLPDNYVEDAAEIDERALAKRRAEGTFTHTHTYVCQCTVYACALVSGLVCVCLFVCLQ